MEVFEEHRPLLFSIAYRMLGSAMDAEDMLQEAYLRYQQVDHSQINAPKSYLSKMVTNLCLDQLKSARAQREVYVGPWLPEPIKTDQLTSTTEAESISMAFLVLLEQLSPAERAVLILHDVFDYNYNEIGDILGKETAACRQLLHRAKQHITDHRPRYTPTSEEHQTLFVKFMTAVGEGDLQGLVDLLAEDVTSWSDGGGKVQASTRPVHGRNAIAKLLLGLRRFLTPAMTFEALTINAAIAGVLRENGEIRMVMIPEIVDGKIKAIRLIVNPDKLRYLSKQ